MARSIVENPGRSGRLPGPLRHRPVVCQRGKVNRDWSWPRFGVTCVDSTKRQILWIFETQDNVDYATVYAGKVLFGSASDMFYCVDAATGEEIWSVSAEPHPSRGQAVDEGLLGGVVPRQSRGTTGTQQGRTQPTTVARTEAPAFAVS